MDFCIYHHRGFGKLLGMRIVALLALVLLPACGLFAEPPLADQFVDEPVNTDTPRDTMRSFYTAMADYNRGLDANDGKLQERINDAIRCFDLNGMPVVGRRQTAFEAAVYLKEIIDRSVVLDYSQIPGTADKSTWKSRGGSFVIKQKKDGDQEGEFLITAETVSRLPDLFEQIKSHPYVKGGGQGAGYREPWANRHLPSWAFEKLVGVAYWQWLGLCIALLLALTFRALVRALFGLILRLTTSTSLRWHSRLIKVLTAPLALLAASLFWLVAVHGLRFSGTSLLVFSYGAKILLGLSVVWALCRLADVLGLFLTDYSKRTENRLDDQLVNLITRTLKIVVAVTGILVVIQNLGIQVFSVIAGLGIGGLAVALAAKDTLANFFGSIMIMIDRPFRVGHYIKVGAQEGTVEAIGFRSTKIRTPHNSLVSIPSAELSVASVDNLGMRQYRRVRVLLGVTYDTTPEKMTQFIDGIKVIISGNRHCPPNFAVAFNDFNSSSLDILVNFFLDVPGFAEELAEKEKIFLEIMQLAGRIGVSFAFPSQSLYIEKMPDAK